jgi:hypothetical protein
VEQVAVLLYRIMADNPKLASLYTTGVFFFILMYTGSNLLPIGRFLAMSHDKQAFRYFLSRQAFITTKFRKNLLENSTPVTPPPLFPLSLR